MQVQNMSYLQAALTYRSHETEMQISLLHSQRKTTASHLNRG